MKQLLLKFTDWLDKTKKDISKKDLQTVYKKARNLRQLLVRGKITQYQPTLGFSMRCNKPCKTCPRMDTSNTITSTEGISYKIQGKFTCQSRYIMCVMTCNICQKQYVGETSQTLNKRFRMHESVIRSNSENNIAEHFNLPNHSPISYTVKIVSQEVDKNKRLRLEESWIHLLNTFQPNGLNLKL